MSNEHSRRWFLRAAAAGAAVAGCVAHAYAWTRSLVPNVLYEPPKKRKLGAATRFPEGPTFLREEKIFVVRTGTTLRALSAVCTHLGCAVGVKDEGFHCPCHGSVFDEKGTNTSGPAPRPLPWHPLSIRAGAVIVDLGSEVGPDITLDAPLPKRKRRKRGGSSK